MALSLSMCQRLALLGISKHLTLVYKDYAELLLGVLV